ncbi:MAG: shikimate kinase [Bdellovibrionota bacterium]
MKRILIGHRGVGKSSLLERHAEYFSEIPGKDLDVVIAEKENQALIDIFNTRGEAAFRELEKKYFLELTTGKDYCISVGAGFNPELLPTDAEVVYVSRRTDADGRIFLNRPRLNPEVSALEESIQRYHTRESNFRKMASWVYHLPEGLCESDEIEESIFKKDFKIDNAYYTLSYEQEIKLWPNLDKFELRTDVFSVENIKRITESYTDKRFLVSVRLLVSALELRGLRVDWALECGPIPAGVNAQIISLHEGEFVQALALIQQQPEGKHLKFCPIVNSWDELIIGYQWQQEDSKNRSFLPRSPEGVKSRWRWFRNLSWAKQKINFVQGLKDFDDQPSVYEYLLSQNPKKQFGAVLGDPIHHSRTPATQGPNLLDYGMILAVPLTEDDFAQGISFLQELGLRFAAVTSPLKLKAAELIGVSSSDVGINSLFFQHLHWAGISSDADGFETMVDESDIPDLKNLKIAIWGGAGVISALKEVLPAAVEYSARSGERRDQKVDSFVPDVVIWAAPRVTGVQLPPASWKPKYILDLNYVENSMGLEYAQRESQAAYFSGLEMFYGQAKKQFKFWAKYLMAEG